MGPSSFLVRNTEWKSWFQKYVHSKQDGGAHGYFNLSTPHESDAAGIALYLGSVILPEMISDRINSSNDNLN